MRLEMVDPERAGEMKYQALQGLCVVVATRFHTGKLRRAGSQGEAPYGTVVHYFPGSNHSPPPGSSDTTRVWPVSVEEGRFDTGIKWEGGLSRCQQ